MNDLGTHVALFLGISSAIVVLGTFYAEADDRRALRMLPRRMLSFVAGCLVVVAIMLVCEHTFASIG